VTSGYFFKVATGAAPNVTRSLGGSKTAGDIQVKMQDGSSLSVGKISDSLLELKKQVQAACSCGIPVREQRYYVLRESKNVELVEDWRRLSSLGVKAGDTLLLLPREVWQRTDSSSKTVHLSLPAPCVDVFERVLDFMYSYRCDGSCFSKLGELTPSSALGALWLAGHLDIVDLQLHILSHLESRVTEQNAHLYLGTAVELGLERALESLTSLASSNLANIPAETLCGLPLEVMEGLLKGAFEAAGGAAKAGWRAVASYLRARDAEGKLDERLDEELFLRLTRGHSGSRQDGEGLEAIEVEDALLLIGLARRFRDEELEGRCLRLAAGGFSGVRVEDLARLNARVVERMLSDDQLEVGSEDEVYQAAAAYVAGRGGELTEEEKGGVWACVRFGWCSAEVQAALLRLQEARGVLSHGFAVGMVAERVGREGGSVEGALGAVLAGMAQARPRRKWQSPAVVSLFIFKC
jgi:BTB And C-terminal Kelch